MYPTRVRITSSIAPNRASGPQTQPRAKVAVSIFAGMAESMEGNSFLSRMRVVVTYHFSTSGNGINAWNVVLVKDKKRNGKSKTNQNNQEYFN
jgi:hypothetical protein